MCITAIMAKILLESQTAASFTLKRLAMAVAYSR